MFESSRLPFLCNSCRQTFKYGAIKRPSSKHVRTTWRTYSTTRGRPLRLAIIGSGPAGFYTAHRVMQKLPDVRIDMYESLPAPFGLVRFGVAPDHPEVKKCQDKFTKIATSPNFNFAGNVPIGDAAGSLPLRDIVPHYDAVLFAYGASEDRTLGVPGEYSKQVVSARAFVGWYNALPEYAGLNPQLDAGETAIVIGQGNVALDVTRILLSPLEELRKTDIAEHALEALSRSRVREVEVIGRRGPLQAPYTIKELRELMHLPGVAFDPPLGGWDELIPVERKRLPRQLRRIAEVLEEGTRISSVGAEKMWQLGFMRTPSAFITNDGGELNAVEFERTTFASQIPTVLSGDTRTDLTALRALKVRGTGAHEQIPASLAFRSVGYKSKALQGFSELGIPFDDKLGILPNDRLGRVVAPGLVPGGLSAGHVPGMYCSGWVKRGSTGVIASTMNDAFTTGEAIARDWEDGVENVDRADDPRAGWDAVQKSIKKRGIRSVCWQDWEAIDAEEKRRGKAKGKERNKMKSVGEMLRVLDR